MSSQIDDIIARWSAYLVARKEEEYKPEPANYSAPRYEPLPVKAGPKAITLEEYKQRQIKKTSVQTIKTQKKKRAGKRYQIRKKLAILYRDLNLATEKKLQKEIKLQIKTLQKEKTIK